jgi:hypothetical protein
MARLIEKAYSKGLIEKTDISNLCIIRSDIRNQLNLVATAIQERLDKKGINLTIKDVWNVICNFFAKLIGKNISDENVISFMNEIVNLKRNNVGQSVTSFVTQLDRLEQSNIIS